MFLIWALYDLFRKNGRWRKDLAKTGLDQPAEPEAMVTQEVPS